MGIKQLCMSLALAAFVCGCAENRASFFVMGILEPDQECRAEPSEEGPYITQGYLDIAYSASYVFYPQLSNQLSSRGDEQNLIAESNGIQVEGANVQIWPGSLAQGDTITEFYQPAACYVPPQGIASCGFIPLPEGAMQQVVASFFRRINVIGGTQGYNDIPSGEFWNYEDDIITIGIQMLGTTNGGKEVETPYFYFTVTLEYARSTGCPPPNPETGDRCTETAPAEVEGCVGQGELVDCCLVGEAWCDAVCIDF